MLNVDGKGLTELDSQILKLLNEAFYNNWRYEFEAGSRMDLETFKSKTFFHLQSLEDMPVDVDYDLVEKFIEEEHDSGFCTTWGQAFKPKNEYVA